MRLSLILVALAAVIALPFAFRPKEDFLAQAQDSLVIISPHNEAVRYEFTKAFVDYYRKRTGRTVRLDWRTPGGTTEITRYLQSEYYTAFQYRWTRQGKVWTPAVAAAFDNPRIVLGSSNQAPPVAEEARRAFLDSNAGIGIDLFFGGGAYDYTEQAAAGRLVDSGVMQRHPGWFAEDSIPRMFSGETYYDPKGRWVGVVLASFGLCYNADSVQRLGATTLPAAWSDLADPLFFKQVALADPTKSGSAAKAYEMVIQQQMQLAGETDLAAGWARGLNLIQAASANARYFTDSSGRVPVDVAMGDAALGMCIDFYGRFESEAIHVENRPARLKYFTPTGGSSVGVDPVGLLRGAPHPEVAKLFIDFVLSLDGQKLWNFRPGTPGGPVRYALRRLPIRKELYQPRYAADRSDPEANPYAEAKLFTYHPAWTAPLFNTLGFIIRVTCLDCHDEQVEAWRALIAAHFPPRATACFRNLSMVDYETARGKIRPALSSADRIKEVRLARELSEHFRQQYREAAELARQGQ